MKMKKELKWIFFVFLTIISIQYIYAGMYFSGTRNEYNLGDFVDLNVTVEPINEGPLKIILYCDSKSKTIFSGPVIDNIAIPLNFLWIGDLYGECYFQGEYSGETKKSNSNFKISKRLDVSLDKESYFLKPGEEISISGKVFKINGDGANGEVAVSIPFKGASQTNIQTIKESAANTSIGNINNQNFSMDNSTNNITTQVNKNLLSPSIAAMIANFNQPVSSVVVGEKFYGIVSNGSFSLSFILPENIPAGDYKIVVDSYEKYQGVKTNEGTINAYLKIPQVLTMIDVALNNQNFNPGENLSIKVALLDQSNTNINDQVSIIIYDIEKKRIFEKIINSGESALYETATNTKSGYYGLEIANGDDSVTKSIFINEKAIVKYEIRNSTLIVKNIGNIPFNKDIQIELNGKPFVKRINLGVGESKEFRLTGTEGNYEILVKDGENEYKESNVPLTGSAVSVKDISDKEINPIYTYLLWIVIFIILIVIVLLLSKEVRKRKKRSVTYPNDYGKKRLKLKGVVVAKKPIEEKKPEPKKISEMSFSRILIPPTQAEQGMVTAGKRNNVSVIALKIKNRITRYSKEKLERMIEPVYEKKGAIYELGDFVIAIFSPLSTKKLNNEVDAIKIAVDIATKIDEHNHKFQDKIMFGMSVHSGDIINEIRDKKLKFTAMGNTLSLAKKLAEAADDKVLVSKDAYDKSRNEIRGDKVIVNDIEAFDIKKIVDLEKSKKFIDDFMKRNARDAKIKSNYADIALRESERTKNEALSQNKNFFDF
ncbi:MAG: hypothetical protein Q8N99_08315 [Nanoarchaeota archaeon]|nr:hypothetical protein [Nanoarchaeota archaeon]